MGSRPRLLENNAQHSESVLRTYQDSNKLSVSLFTEELSESGLFSKRKRLRYKSQIYLNGIPIGAAVTIKEDVVSHVDQVKIDNMIEKFAITFLEAGILVANLSPDPRAKAIGAIASGVRSKIRPEK